MTSNKDLKLQIQALAKDIKELRNEFIAKNRHLHLHTSSVVRTERARIDTGTQRLLSELYCQKAADGKILPFSEVGFSNYSQSADDGVLHYIFSLVGSRTKKVIEICAGVGSECNAANLIIHHDWSGLLIEGDEKKYEKAKAFFARHFAMPHMPQLLNTWVDRETIGSVVTKAGYSGEIDLLSLDIDGVDYWVLEALLDVIKPRVMILETQLAWGPDLSKTVQYRSDFQADWQSLAFKESHFLYAGASLAAFQKLGRRFGYRLVGKVGVLGPNTIFLRDDVGPDIFPEIEPSVLFDDFPEVYTEHHKRFRKTAEKFQWVDI